MFSLDGKVAVITGAGRPLGQGWATAGVLAENGAAVVLADIDFASADERARELRDKGFKAQAVETDVREEDQVKAMIDYAIEQFGRLDVLHNQAADLALLADPGDPEVTQASVDQFWALMATLALGPMLGCKYAIPAMLETGGGSIVCTSSISGMAGELNLTIYGMAKAAVNQLVRAVSAQWGKEGIRCNAIAPGLILTTPGLAIGEEGMALYERHCDTPYNGEPADIAHTVAFLASDESRFITGQVLRLDGGLTQHSPIVADQRASGALNGVHERLGTDWATSTDAPRLPTRS